MNKLLSLAMILAASTIVWAGIFETDIGGYYLPTKKIQASAFKNIKHITVDPTGDNSRKVSGFLATSNVNFQFEDSWFDEEEKVFGFQTKKVKGVHYVYSGTFKNLDFLDTGVGNSVLHGKLMKFINGKFWGEIDLVFDFTAGD